SPPEITRAVREERERAEQEAAAKADEPSFVVVAHYASEDDAVAMLASRRVMALHATAVAGSGEGLAAWETTHDALHLAALDNEDVTRAVKNARASKKSGRGGAASNPIAPVARRIVHFRDNGLRVFLTARAQTQAERL